MFVALLSMAGSCAAQAVAPAAAAASAAAPSRAASAAARADVRVIEDDNVRIEETRVRGQTQRITVQSKIGNVRGYEIVVAPGGKDPSQDRGATGRGTWSLFDF